MASIDLFCGSAHLLQGVSILGLLAYSNTSIQATISRTGRFGVLGEKSYNLASLLPVFSLLSSTNHFVRYTSGPVIGNIAQWIEYGMSAGTMLWLIASLSGVVDVSALICILIQNAVLQYIGYRLTQSQSNSQYNRLLMIGFLLHICIWLPIIVTFYSSLESSDNKEEIPKIVYYIVWMMFSLFTVFGVYPLVKNISNIKPNDHRAFSILSLITKSLLTWMVFFGVIRSD